MFSQHDVSWLSASIGSVYSAKNIPELSCAMTSAVDGRFHLFASACEEIGPGFSSYALHRLRTDVAPPRDYAAYMHDNPFHPHLGSDRVTSLWHLRETTTMDSWSRTDHFNGLARPMGFNDQMIVFAQTAPTTAILGLYRDSKFTADERRLAGLLQPHLASAWRRVKSIDAAGAEGPLRICLSASFQPVGISAHVRRVLKAYFVGWNREDRLPANLASWVQRSATELMENPEMRPLRAYTAESARGCLLIRFFPKDRTGMIELVMVEVPASPNFLLLRRFGLTSRECEVMHWLAQGKRDGEIASIIGAAPKTVGKHVEHSLRKFGSSNRTTVVGAALRRLRDMANASATA